MEGEPGGVSGDAGNGAGENAKAAGKAPMAPPADTMGAAAAKRPKLAPEPAAGAKPPAETPAAKAPNDAAAAKDDTAGQVVRFDRFRKSDGCNSFAIPTDRFNGTIRGPGRRVAPSWQRRLFVNPQLNCFTFGDLVLP